MDRTDTKKKRRAVIWRLAALAGYVLLLLAVGVLALGQTMAAALSDERMQLGRQLDGLQQLAGPATELSWNGQRLSLRSAVVGHSLRDALDRVVGLCDGHAGDVAAALAGALGEGPKAAGLFQRMLVLRDLLEDGTGSVVCLAGLGEGGLKELAVRARRFADSSDLSALGGLRYVHLSKVSEQRTKLIVVSADGPLRLDGLLATGGRDAAGDDLVPGARPDRAQRLLSAHALGTPHVLSAYQSRLPADAALRDVGSKLRAHGFAPMAAPAPAAEADSAAQPLPVQSEAYRRREQVLVVSAHSDGEDGSLLSMVQLGADALPSPMDAARRDRSFE